MENVQKISRRQFIAISSGLYISGFMGIPVIGNCMTGEKAKYGTS